MAANPGRGGCIVTQHQNAYGQPVGYPIAHWSPPRFPPRESMASRYCRIEPLTSDCHAAELYAANALEPDSRGWTYVSYGPFETRAEYRQWVDTNGKRKDRLFHAIIDQHSGKAAGVAAYMRIDPSNGSIEIGGIKYTPLIAQRPAATEAMFLLMQRAFALGYRRYEWKCDALNAPSRAAAQRLGFSYEGIFRQAVVYKGRNRDTAWYSILDGEWPVLKKAYEQWLAPENFDAQGQQQLRLSDLTAPLLQKRR